jgi:hypothetical protein
VGSIRQIAQLRNQGDLREVPVFKFHIRCVGTLFWLLDPMNRLLVLLFLVFICGSRYAYAQESFEPCTDEMFPEYHAGVNSVIDSAVGEKPRLSVTTFPSFRPEYGIRIVGSKVYFATLNDSFWYSSNVYDEKTRRGYYDFTKPKLKAKISSAPLSQDLIDRTIKIYVAAISSATKYERLGFDGTTYRFTTPSAGCGKTWSPSQGTRAYQLVALVELLAKHAKLSNERQLKSSTQLIEQKVIALEKQ